MKYLVCICAFAAMGCFTAAGLQDPNDMENRIALALLGGFNAFVGCLMLLYRKEWDEE